MSVLSSVLLRRLRTVYVDQAGPRPGDPSTEEGLVALEAELLDRGFAPTAQLRTALAWLGPAGLADAGRQLVRGIDAVLGADRTHMPLFRSFPASVPDDTFQLFVDRVFTLLLQWPKQPCVLCGTVGSVHPVSPCAHLVCRTCWDGADYSGCPICHRRIDPADPFLKPAPPRRPHELSAGPLKLLALGQDRKADTVRALRSLLARRTPLPPQDREDVTILLAHAPAGLDWFPAEIPVRETKALVLGRMLQERDRRAAAVELFDTHLTTATDVLRLLCVWSGGAADLIEPPRLRTLPRALRRRLLAVLDGLPVATLVEDVLRHPVTWKRAAEILHPYEHHDRHPRAALAFAVLRATDTSGTDLGAALLRTAAEHPEAVRVDGARIKAATWGARVEQALHEKDAPAVLALLAQRPGELLRRLDHLLRLTELDALPDGFADVLRRVLPHAGPGPLLAALGRMRIRHLPSERRVFFPRGQVTHAYTLDDTRPPLARAVTDEVCALLEAEALRRLSAAPRVELAVLDSALAGLAVPSTERADTKALVSVPRGSTQPLPGGEVLRLFLHWTQPARTRVDLDLSVALYDEDWEFTGVCDYTNLVHGDRAAVHSGDLTSAPAPDGATEYVDLDLTSLGGHGVRYAVPVVFSYNNIAFERLLDAFAGFMTLPSAAEEARDASYDPRTVRQRYDLVGDSRIHVPMLVDLRSRTFLWTDLHLSGDDGFHSVHRHGAELGRVGRDLYQYFASGRTTLWELVVWHAAARCDEVAVLRRAPVPGALDELWHYRRRAGEADSAFATRIRLLRAPERREVAEGVEALAGEVAAKKRVLLALVHGGVAPEGASGEAYRLLPGPVDGCGLQALAAGDLVAALG
ncbi:MXAN_6230/SCO0854 family RING domain-containing protein [Streptomyces sp. Li-HN-5-11]|uniref:MXAN_6230/SCO0854 family RING domain-containing protein n=1 Tax=Streptomyces sp. Li-HN-5-11 TaxID=3075432 RepID=UPI0028A6E41A|nr:MXAN_6230/SCO0854 family RING domain-containing protein [Streptomyces sp. Li-HN-5-11]WNM34271.1 MXAN_6230/SCO0854 family RING domain-containing protein [Streptomyces sp. Li-HN-5-11]